MKFFSHSYLLLYTEDSVVLKSESNNQQRRVVVETVLQGSIVSPSYHTGDYHPSLYIHDLFPFTMDSVLIESRSRASVFPVRDYSASGGSCVISTILISSV